MAQQLNSGVLSMEANIDCPVISAAFPTTAPGKACVVTSSCALPCGEAPEECVEPPPCSAGGALL